MKKLTENAKCDLACEIAHALAKTPDAYEQLCASYGISRAFDLSDDDLRKEYIRYVKAKKLNVPQHSKVDVNYLAVLQELVNESETSDITIDRTKVGTYSIFGRQIKYDLSKSFPILSTKKVYMQGVIAELLWFLRGDSNIKYLLENKCKIWTSWCTEKYNQDYSTNLTNAEFEQLVLTDEYVANYYGSVGNSYSHNWRNFGEVVLNDCDTDLSESMNHEAESGNDVVKTGFDQISWIINEIKTNPTSRRLVVSAWNPNDHLTGKAVLASCHCLFQFFVKDEKLSCQLYQRSADYFLGKPFNIASYALLTHIIAQECDLGVGEFVWSGGDVHLYTNHIEQAKEQLSRSTLQDSLPQIFIPNKPIDQLTVEDIELFGYVPQSTIKAPVAV